MAKARTQFLCNNCGSVHPKWMGKCPDCGTWDAWRSTKRPTADAQRPRADRRRAQTGDIAHGAEPLTLDEIDDADAPRTPTGIGEFDRILGGGIVPGSAVLVGGEPGIGKSTLLLQVAQDCLEARHEATQATKARSGKATAKTIRRRTPLPTLRPSRASAPRPLRHQRRIRPADEAAGRRGSASTRRTCSCWPRRTSSGSSTRSTRSSRRSWSSIRSR